MANIFQQIEKSIINCNNINTFWIIFDSYNTLFNSHITATFIYYIAKFAAKNGIENPLFNERIVYLIGIVCRNISLFKNEELCSIIFAYSILNTINSTLFNLINESIIYRLSTPNNIFLESELITIIHSYSILKFYDINLFYYISNEINIRLQNDNNFSLKDLDIITYSYATLGIYDINLFQILAEKICIICNLPPKSFTINSLQNENTLNENEINSLKNENMNEITSFNYSCSNIGHNFPDDSQLDFPEIKKISVLDNLQQKSEKNNILDNLQQKDEISSVKIIDSVSDDLQYQLYHHL